MTSWQAALTGGALIGLSVVLMMGFMGRIAGISGILGGGITGANDGAWRWLFLLGLPLGGILFHQISGASIPVPFSAGWLLTIVAGLLVGYGTRLGSGCTSGHGICGISRFSPRSIVATLIFVGTGMVTVTIIRHLLGGY